MATLVENAAEIVECSRDIDSAIEAWGGKTDGGLRNAPSSILNLPVSKTGWRKRPWENDGNIHLWFEIEDVPNKKISFAMYITSDADVTVDWDDGQTTTIVGPISNMDVAFDHLYLAKGVYEVSIIGVKSTICKGTGIFHQTRSHLAPRSIRQYELGCQATFSQGNQKVFSSLYNLYYVKLNTCNLISDNMFLQSPNLHEVEGISKCESIGQSCMNLNTSLENIPDINDCLQIGQSAFKFCYNLKSVGNLNSCTSIGESVFSDCVKLESVGDIPLCTSIAIKVFQNCISLKSLGDIHSCTSIGDSGFDSCANLVGPLSIPNCINIGSKSFTGTYNLKYLTLGTLTTVGANSFYDIGCELLPDSDGFTSVITVGNTMAGLRAISGLPWGAPTTTKFVCSDGYIAYEGGAWTDHLV